ncbi:TetR/AcrR family transcriptional regulator [Hydrocarboniphaga sp.]|uniref:TetR/AcrR family transcriptional regulator n=1 Tax=Hydrocarboniphaga sp. TaxID=2033016 RepID=UPI003D106967
MKAGAKSAKPRSPRLSREAQRELKTEAILEGAWVTFCKKGYESLTLDEVAEYAGVSRMPVYWLFGDKQNLFFELWKKVIADLLQQIGARMTSGAPLRRNLETLARLTAEGQAPDKPRYAEGLFFVVQTIALSRPDIEEKLLQVSNEVVERFAGFVRDSVLEEGQQLRGPATTVAAHLVAQINGLSTVQFQTHRQFVKARDLMEIFTAIALKSPAG